MSCFIDLYSLDGATKSFEHHPQSGKDYIAIGRPCPPHLKGFSITLLQYGMISWSIICEPCRLSKYLLVLSISCNLFERSIGDGITVEQLCVADRCKPHWMKRLIKLVSKNCSGAVHIIDNAVDLHTINECLQLRCHSEICVSKKQRQLLLICRRRNTDMQRKIVLLLIHQVD